MQKLEHTTTLIQERVRALLAAGTIDLFIGYKQGSNSLRINTHVVKNEQDADSLVWNLACMNSLVPVLKKYPDQKVGILVKGCDSRALVELLKLHQLQREKLYILGVPCTGMVDPKRAASKHAPADMNGVTAQDDGFVILEKSGNTAMYSRDELLAEKCTTCATPTPVMFDELVGDAIDAQPAAVSSAYAAVEELEQLTPTERFAFWAEQFSACTLCYACQTVCPLCFCKECTAALAKNDPRRKERRQEDVFSFHMIRAYHMVGRCVGCMECERVCPVDIPLGAIFQKVEKETRELFDYTAGLNVDDVIPLSTFAETDQMAD